MHDQHRRLGHRFQLIVGNHHGHFDDTVAIRIESGHFHIQPYKVILILCHNSDCARTVERILCHTRAKSRHSNPMQMTPFLFSKLFIAALLLTTATKLWLAKRHLAYIKSHRAQVPSPFNEKIDLAAHQKAADYTSSKTHLAMLEALFEAVVLWGFTLGGGIQKIASFWPQFFISPIAQGMGIIVTVLIISGLLEAPFSLYRTFGIEARYGFNKTTLALYLLDALKGLLLAAVLGLPLLFGVLWMMERMGENWWLYVWAVWVVFNLLILFIYPTLIAPLFNKFSPLAGREMKIAHRGAAVPMRLHRPAGCS